MKLDSRIYVAGHSGLIGSSFMRCLPKAGFVNVIVESRANLDLREQASVDDFFERVRPECVILAAGKVGGILDNISQPFDYISVNSLIQNNVFNAAVRHRVEKLVFFGSSCMYPRDCAQPMQERLLLSGMPEATSLAYAVSKLSGVQACLAHNQQFGNSRFIPVIPSSVYGPNDDFEPKSSHVLSGLIRKFHDAKEDGLGKLTLWGTGAPRREFIYSDDLAEAVITLLLDDMQRLEYPLNIGVGMDISIKELACMIAATVGYKGKIEWDSSKPDGSPRKLLDSSRFCSGGWQPRVDLAVGLGKTYAWFLDSQKNPK